MTAAQIMFWIVAYTWTLHQGPYGDRTVFDMVHDEPIAFTTQALCEDFVATPSPSLENVTRKCMRVDAWDGHQE